MIPRLRRALRGTLLAASLLASVSHAAGPDFSGIWQVNRAYSVIGNMRQSDGRPIPLLAWNEALHMGYNQASRSGQPWPPNNQRCLVAGTVRAMKGNFPWRWLQTDEQVTLLFEEDGRVNVFPFAKEFPADIKPTWTGTGISRQEGDTVVIEVKGFNGKTPFPHAIHHTSLLHIVHRFKLLPSGQLEDRMTITDPGAFERPFEAVTLFERKRADYRMIDYRCAENNRELPERYVWWGADWGPE